MQGISKRVAFLDYLDKCRGFVSAKRVGEGVTGLFGEEYHTDTAERNGILNALSQDHLVKWRKPLPDEREAKQQRFVFAATSLGKRVAETNRAHAEILVREVQGGQAA
jgi:hypothetical protein